MAHDGACVYCYIRAALNLRCVLAWRQRGTSINLYVRPVDFPNDLCRLGFWIVNNYIIKLRIRRVKNQVLAIKIKTSH